MILICCKGRGKRWGRVEGRAAGMRGQRGLWRGRGSIGIICGEHEHGTRGYGWLTSFTGSQRNG